MDSVLRLLRLDSLTLSRSSFSRASITGSIISYPGGGGLDVLFLGILMEGCNVLLQQCLSSVVVNNTVV